MKIKKLKLENFAKFTNFEIEFDGKITNLIGINGSGKTTIGLTAIWACLKGISENSGKEQLIGERYRFIGDNKKTADIELTLFDEEKNVEIKIKNHISKDANKITFDAPITYEIDNTWLNNLFSVAFLSAKNFTQQSPKEQALLLGIDTSKFDVQLKNLKQDYTYINRKIRNAGEIKSIEKVEKISINELLQEKDNIDKFNKIQQQTLEKQNHVTDCLNKVQNQIRYLRDEYNFTAKPDLQKIFNDLLDIKQKICMDLKPLPEKDTTYILNKINNVEKINQQAMLYDMYLQKKAEYDANYKELENNKINQQEVIQEKIEFIKSFNFGFEKLSVNDDGELLLDEKPIQDPYFSKGELEIIVAKLYIHKNPNLKVRFIDDFELLDEKNQENLIKTLLDNGFQIITAQIRDAGKSKDNTIFLRECKKINETKGD
jgi:recombinational DNA repair ATPase RecF